MNATTAEPSATTPKTSNTDGANGANSLTNPRIDATIRRLLGQANSGDFSALKSSANAAQKHGFTNSANSRLVDFLEEFRPSPLRSHYEEKYPACCFLTFEGLRGLMRSLSLWCDLPENYTGAIPPEQLPWLDLFSLDAADTVPRRDILKMCDVPPELERVVDACLADDYWSTIFDESPVQLTPWDRGMRARYRERIMAATRKFRSSYMVVAPPEAFNTTEDFFERFRKLVAEASRVPKITPDDPLVIRFVKGGALVVAAWGEEAAFLNAAAREMNV